MKKNIILLLSTGCVYLLMELANRWFSGSLIGFEGQTRMSLTGWTSFWMLPIGGLCGLIAGQMNEWVWSRKLRNIFQVFIAAFFVLVIEFTTGVILNVWLGLSVWDYSEMKFNLLGQICLKNGLMFLLIMPLSFWIDDVIRYYRFNEGEKTDLYKYYLNTILLK